MPATPLEPCSKYLLLMPSEVASMESSDQNVDISSGAVRRRQATRLLAEGKTKLSVAVRLGYSDDRTLRRAACRWENQGQPPHSTGPTGTEAPAPQAEQPDAFATHPGAFRPSQKAQHLP
jgi:hypothetical protein